MPTTSLFIPWFTLHSFTLGGRVQVHPFGVLIGLGIVVGTWVAKWRARRTGVDPVLIGDFLLYTLAIGLPTSYVLNAPLYDWEGFVGMLSDPRLFLQRYTGLSSFMGFLSGVAAALLFRHRRRVSILVMGDLFCFAFPSAWFFGRMGCFLLHDHPGVVTDFFLAVENWGGRGPARHDLGLYEMLWSAVTFPLVCWIGRRELPRGFFMAFVPLCYAPVRFLLDFLREVPAHGGDVRYFGLTPGQYGSLVMFVAGLLVALRIARGPAPTIYLDGRGDGREPAPSR